MRLRSRERWTARGFALVLLALLGGCRWIPARHPSPALDPRQVSRDRARADQDAPNVPTASNPTDGVPLPPLPLRPISSDEALASAPPTPQLDAALARAQHLQEILLSDLDESRPAVIEAPPSHLETDAASSVEDRVAVSEPPIAPARVEVPEAAPTQLAGPSVEEPTLAAVAPSVAWSEGLAKLIKLAQEQARAAKDSQEVWSIRERMLALLTDEDSKESLWQTVLSSLAEADASAVSESTDMTPSTSTESPVPPSAFAVTDLKLCRKVLGFGNIEPTDPEACRAGQSLILYWEVEGLQVETDEGWFRTRLSSTAEILPETGETPIWSRSLGTAEDRCLRRRRDYFVNSRLTIPATLAPGTYRLRLIQQDLVARVTTSRDLAFTILPEPRTASQD